MQIIPKNWLLDENYSYFPPNYLKMSVIAYDRCVMKMEDPKSDWNICKIIGIIGSRGNYYIIILYT